MDGGSGSTANMKDSTSCQQDPSELEIPGNQEIKRPFFFQVFCRLITQKHHRRFFKFVKISKRPAHFWGTDATVVCQNSQTWSVKVPMFQIGCKHINNQRSL